MQRRQTRLRPGAGVLRHIFSDLLAHTSSEKDVVMLHTRSTGELFDLWRLRAKTKTKCVLILELLFADEAALVAQSKMHLQDLRERFAKVCTDFGMTINLKTTDVMSLGTSIPPRILINGWLPNVVDKFTYLGSVVNSSNNLDGEIKPRLGKASTNFGQLSFRVWKNHHLAIKLPIKVRTASILSVLLYSNRTWCTYRRQENRLKTFQCRCLRSILGVSWRYHVPDYNILHITGSYDLTAIIRQRRLCWLGHVHRIEVGRLPNDILYDEFYSAPRKTAGPKLRYKCVNQAWHLSTVLVNTCCWSQQMACLSELWLFIVNHKLHRKIGEVLSSSSSTTGWDMMMMVANWISCSMAVLVTASHLFKTSLLFLASL